MKRKLMLLLACLFVGISLVTAQTQKITGVVISEEDGQPVVGASVLVKGTTQGTITDVDGNFNLANVPSMVLLRNQHLPVLLQLLKLINWKRELCRISPMPSPDRWPVFRQ